MVGARLGHFVRSLLIVVLTLSAPLALTPTAAAATGDVGIAGPSYPSSVTAPTADKPQSKLWFNDGRWWAAMVNSSGAWRIYYLNRSATPETWVDSGTAIDARANTSTDALWANGKLYVAAQVKASSSSTVVSGQPARLYQYSYNSTTKTYALDSGFPKNINDTSSESVSIDVDSVGRIWATWTASQKVYVNVMASGTWGTPFVLPVNNATGLDADDISAIVSFAGKIGVLWSSQSNSSVYFAYRDPSAAVSTWNQTVSVPVTSTPGSPGSADDHLSIKQVQGDSTGRLFAVVKTSLDNTGASSPQIVVVGRSATGAWSKATFGTVGDCHTRPQLMVDTTNNLLHVFATAPDSGCPFPGSAGSIYEKTSSMSTLAFPSGKGTRVIRDAASANMNNVTSSKQSVSASTGLVVLASNDTTKRYWFADESLGAAVSAPVADFTATPTSGTAPLTSTFTDTSTNKPTSWAWDFGDGTTSTAQNPSHTYSTVGSFTVTLTATNSAGSNVVTKSAAVTVTSTPTPGGISVVGSSSAYSGTATTTVAFSAPTGAKAGDVLVASITADNNPTMSTVPAGWTAMVNGLSVNAAASAGAKVYAYYHVVTAGESSTYTWTLSSAQKWGAGVTAYRGVNNATPLDTPVVTGVNTSYTGTSLTLGSLTTSKNGAMLIGAVGLDSSTPLVSPPSGWKQEWQAAGGQIAAMADVVQATAGPSGIATWTLSSGRAFGGWRSALRPSS